MIHPPTTFVHTCNQCVGMPGCPGIPVNQLSIHIYGNNFKFYIFGSQVVKFVSEQVAQYKHHILSAKEIGKSLLLETPDHSPFHQSIEAAQENLYYLNYLSRAIPFKWACFSCPKIIIP